MKKLCVPQLSKEQHLELEQLHRKTEVSRVRIRAQMVLLSAEKSSRPMKSRTSFERVLLLSGFAAHGARTDSLISNFDFKAQ